MEMEFHQKPNIFVSMVELKVEDFNRSLSFYQKIIGFKILEQSERKAVLTADGKSPLLSIMQPENVIPKQPRTTGLYHYALLLPSRAELGKVLKHLIQVGYPLQGGSDHLVSEAIYLADPDGNGIEIYTDRPSSTWKWTNSMVEMATDMMDVEGILAEGGDEEWSSLPKETVMGHIHLHVSDLSKAEEFYCNGLGFNVVCRYGDQALFISTGGYHHHIGLNTWNGVNAPTPAENSVGLYQYHLVFPAEDEREKTVGRIKDLGYFTNQENGQIFTKDPSGNQIYLVV
jgi:catechol 2,3-dioxygenase